MSSVIVFHEAEGSPVGIVIKYDTENFLDAMKERFDGDYDRIVEWINDGISGGGYDTPYDMVPAFILGDSTGESLTALKGLDIAESGISTIYRVNKTGTFDLVEARISVNFVKSTQNKGRAL